MIAGGGVGDDEIDGEINVAVIDYGTETPITTGATVDVGGKQKMTEAKASSTVLRRLRPQTVAVKMAGYRSCGSGSASTART